MTDNAGKAALVFVHGRGGDAATWGRFPELLRADAEIAARFVVVDPIEYRTNALGSGPAIDELARDLETSLLRPEIARCASIVIFAHSMGGLVARRLVCDLLAKYQRSSIQRILAFATPHLGSALAGGPMRGRQDQDLVIGSDFMLRLGRDWAHLEADKQVQVHHLVAADDAIVGEWSATAGFRYAGFERIAGENHRSLVKPQNAEAAAYKAARFFLLKQPRPGHAPARPEHYEQPVLESSTFPDDRLTRDNSTRLVYRARAVPFFGREAQWAQLTDFMGTGDPFRWWAIQGAGGVGKSRLALELCLASESSWYAGFLPETDRQRDWARWQPLAPTLIVVDYALKDADTTKRLLHDLANRTLSRCAYPLQHPVRVLLLIRDDEKSRLDTEIVGAGSASHVVKQVGQLAPLLLRDIADPWPIFEAVFRQAGRPLPDRPATLAALQRIDAQRRPLFALLLADALAAGDGMGALAFDASRLMEDVIERWRTQFWQPALRNAGLGLGQAEETLLALATLCGGLKLADGKLPAADVFGLLPAWNPHLHPNVLGAMAGRTIQESVPPLEPDIVGEYFLVAQWRKRRPNEREALLKLAWAVSSFGTAAFLDRLSQDLSHAQLNDVLDLLFCDVPVDNVGPWLMLGVNLAARFHANTPVVVHRLSSMRQVAQTRGGTALWELWAKGTFNLLSGLRIRDPQTAQLLLDDLRQIAQARDEVALWEQWTNGAFNLLDSLSSSDLKAARVLLNDMRQVVQTRDEAALWEPWASGAVNLLTRLSINSDPQAARLLLNEVRQVAQTRDEAAIWTLWARGAFNLITNLSSKDLKAARLLLNDMRQIAQIRDEAALWTQWAKGAVNLLSDLSSSDLKAAEVLLNDMRQIAQTREEIALWEQWINGAFNLLNSLSSSDLKAAEVLLSDMRQVAQTHDAAVLWEPWASGAVNLLSSLHSSDPKAAQVLLNDMHQAAQACDEAALWDLWSKGAFNLLNGLISTDLKTAWLLLNEMRLIAQSRDEAALWEQWAKGTVNLLRGLSNSDFKTARVLLDDIHQLAQTRDEAALWEQWAKGTFNLLTDLCSSDVKAARLLLDNLRQVTQTRDEAALWELWASSALNLLSRLCKSDFKAARVLLDNLREAAQTRNEAALWELWSKGSVNLLSDLSNSDFEAAKLLLDEMHQVAEIRDEAALWELSAKGSFNLLNGLCSNDLKAAQLLLNNMRLIAQTRDKAVLWEMWAKGAFNLLNDLRSSDLKAALVLLEDMRQVAKTRDEVSLWEPWARGAANLLDTLSNSDPQAALALQNDIFEELRRLQQHYSAC